MDYDYSELQPELIDAIAKKITGFVDYVRFRAVRSEWRSIISRKPHQLPCQLPWLMLPFDLGKFNDLYSKKEIYKTGFFDVSESKVRHWWVPEFRSWIRCCGSSHGCLVLLDLVNATILLLNPITRSKVELPPITSFPNVFDLNLENMGEEYVIKYPSVEEPYTHSLQAIHNFFIKKIVLFSSPTSPDKDYMAVAILGLTKELAFVKKGDESWTIIEAAESYCEDVIFFKGLICAVNKEGSLIFVDVNHVVSNVSPAVAIITPPKPVPEADMIYLVDSFRGVLLVTRYLDSKHDPELGRDVYKTTGFDVFSLDAGKPKSAEKPKWDEVKSLGDHMLFLGGLNDSLCLLATDFYGCERNCIYFTDDFCTKNELGPGDHDVGVFNLGDRSIKPLSVSTGSRLRFPSPIWFTPNPCS